MLTVELSSETERRKYISAIGSRRCMDPISDNLQGEEGRDRDMREGTTVTVTKTPFGSHLLERRRQPIGYILTNSSHVLLCDSTPFGP